MFRQVTLATAIAVYCLNAATAVDPKMPPGFDDLVAPGEVRSALVRLDPATLANVAAKVAAAEQKLGRARPGASAALLYETAIRLAAERRNAALLTRLASDERVKADARLTTLLENAKLVAGSARNNDPEMVVALDQISPEQFNLFRGYLIQIQDAKALADKDALDALAEHVAGVAGLTGPQKKYLAKQVNAAREKLPAKPPAAVVEAKQAHDVAVRVEASGPDPDEPSKGAAKGREPGDNDNTPESSPKKGSEAPGAGGGGGVGAKLGGDAAALVDEGFEGRIDIAKIGKAWQRNDAVALTDYAFRMADEERILGRSHKHLPAKMLFDAAIKLADRNEDAETIARLEKGLQGERAPDFQGKQQLLAKLTAIKGLVASSRKGPEPFLVSIDQVSPESFAVFRASLERLRAAAAQRDVAMLTALVEGLDSVIELDDSQRAYLAREVAGARKAGSAGTDEGIAALRLLAGGERGGVPEVNRKVLDFCRARVGQKVDNGNANVLVLRAIESAGARKFPPFGPKDDRVWGRVVKPVDALPGDILQFKDAVFKVTASDGSTRQWTYTHHAAVIQQSEGANRFAILHQNVGSAGKSDNQKQIVQIGHIDMKTLASGTVTIYRPIPDRP